MSKLVFNFLSTIYDPVCRPVFASKHGGSKEKEK